MAKPRFIPKPIASEVMAPTRLDLSPDPTIKGKGGAVDWYRETMGLEHVGIGLVTKATNDRTLPSYGFGGVPGRGPATGTPRRGNAVIPTFWLEAMWIAIRTAVRIWMAYNLIHSVIEFR